MTQAALEAKRSTWKWNAKREQAALMLAEGKTWAVIQETLGISASTLYSWKLQPEFQQRLDEHHEAVIAEAKRILRRNAAFAAQRVVDLAFNGRSEHSTRLAAAKDILDRVGLKAPEKHDSDQNINITITDARQRLAHRLLEATAEGDTYTVVGESE